MQITITNPENNFSTVITTKLVSSATCEEPAVLHFCIYVVKEGRPYLYDNTINIRERLAFADVLDNIKSEIHARDFDTWQRLRVTRDIVVHGTYDPSIPLKGVYSVAGDQFSITQPFLD